jgi:hypothetical protein
MRHTVVIPNIRHIDPRLGRIFNAPIAKTTPTMIPQWAMKNCQNEHAGKSVPTSGVSIACVVPIRPQKQAISKMNCLRLISTTTVMYSEIPHRWSGRDSCTKPIHVLSCNSRT